MVVGALRRRLGVVDVEFHMGYMVVAGAWKSTTYLPPSDENMTESKYRDCC